VFEGRGGDAPLTILDGGSVKGPSPMEALLLSLGGCMAVDIQAILEKGRVPLDSLVVELEGERASEPPERFTRIRMDVRVRGPQARDRAKVERAVQLSQDKYCSVFHTLRSDLVVQIEIHRE